MHTQSVTLAGRRQMQSILIRAVRFVDRLIGQRVRKLIPLEMQAWSLADGFRAATACALPVLLAQIFHQRDLSWVAIVAFWGCLSDTGGTWRSRFVAMASFTGLATLGVGLASIYSRSLIGAVGLAMLWSFTFGMARALGGPAGSVGNLLVIAVLVSLSMPSEGLHADLLRLGCTALGGLWAMLLALVLWRIYPHRPARRAVSRVWHELGMLMRLLASAYEGTIEESAWLIQLRQSRGRAREAIEAARITITTKRRSQSGPTTRGELILVLLADADQAFENLIALSEILDAAIHAEPARASPPGTMEAASSSQLTPPSPPHAKADRIAALILHRLSRQAEALAAILQEREAPTYRHAGRALTRLEHVLEKDPSQRSYYAARLLRRLIGYLDVAGDVLRGVMPSTPPGEETGDNLAEPGFDLATAWSNLRGNLTPQSLTFRHAVRIAVTGGVGQALISGFNIDRGYWIVITAVIVLQPYLAATWRRTLERAAGSVLGGLAAAAIGWYLSTPLEIAAVIFPLSVVAMAFRQVNYAVFTFWLTPQFVLIAELFQAGDPGDLRLAALRALYSVLGGALGLVAALFLMPTRELPLLPPQLARMLRARADYLAAALARLCAAAPSPGRAKLAQLRRLGGLAGNNLETALQRLLSEPRWRAPREAEPAMTLIVAGRRLAGVAAALSLSDPVDAADRPTIAAFRAWAVAALEMLAESMQHTRPPPALPPPPAPFDQVEELESDTSLAEHRIFVHAELARLIRQIEILHAAATRFAQPTAPTPRD